MTLIVVAFLLIAIAIQFAVLGALLVQRRALRQREAFFRHLTEDAPMIMWTARPDATLDYLNNFCVEFSEMPLEQLLGDGCCSTLGVTNV